MPQPDCAYLCLLQQTNTCCSLPWLRLQGYGGRGGNVANGRTRERDDAAWKAAGQLGSCCVAQQYGTTL